MFRTAGAYRVLDFHTSSVFRLKDHISVFDAELITILQALGQLIENDHDAVIFTEAMTAVKAIESVINSSRRDIVHDILEMDTWLKAEYI